MLKHYLLRFFTEKKQSSDDACVSLSVIFIFKYLLIDAWDPWITVGKKVHLIMQKKTYPKAWNFLLLPEVDLFASKKRWERWELSYKRRAK